MLELETLTKQTNKNEDKVSEIIDRVLKQVFGEEATRLIYRHLENNYSVKQNEIVEKIDLFSKGLEDFLTSGARVIELKILEDLYSSYGSLRRLELERTREEYDFVGQMRTLMREA